MTELQRFIDNPLLLGASIVLLAVILWIVFRFFQGRRGGLEKTLVQVSFDRIEGLIIPSADEGEILIDHLLLTAQGLLILEVKDVQGTVFGGDKLRDWSVIAADGRFTFSNPQPALYDRIAAVRQVVREVPVAGRILFLDGAEFTKGVPNMVTNCADLSSEFAESDKSAANVKIEAFKPHWEKLRQAALESAAK